MSPPTKQQRSFKQLANGFINWLNQTRKQLSPEQLTVAISGLALAVSLFFPWYDKRYAIPIKGGDSAPAKVSESLSAWGVFSFIEAAVLLTAAVVVALIVLRAERFPLRFPISDGRIAQFAGGWATLLLTIRMFDRPDPATGEVGTTFGVMWGIFFALGASIATIYFGGRLHQAGQRRLLPSQSSVIDIEPPPDR